MNMHSVILPLSGALGVAFDLALCWYGWRRLVRYFDKRYMRKPA